MGNWERMEATVAGTDHEGKDDTHDEDAPHPPEV